MAENAEYCAYCGFRVYESHGILCGKGPICAKCARNPHRYVSGYAAHRAGSGMR